MDFDDLDIFRAVARGGGFRKAARLTDRSVSTISTGIARLEARLGVRLFQRTTRSVRLTEVGEQVLARLGPALDEVSAALDVVNAFRDTPRGKLRLNVPGAVMRGVLPPLLMAFLNAYPEIDVELTVDENLVDIFGAGADAGIRYGETLEQDVIAIPLGPRRQEIGLAAAPSYLARRGTPTHPRELLKHDCLKMRFPDGRPLHWEFEKNGQSLRIEPRARLIVTTSASNTAIEMALAGMGFVRAFEDWLRPMIADGRLLPVLRDWWPAFEGPWLYYAGRRQVPTPLRAFVDFVKAQGFSESSFSA